MDGAIGSLDALELIMKSSRVREAQASGKFTVLFDSGIRNGSDVMKALALGAQAILRTCWTLISDFSQNLTVINSILSVGRPYLYGLAINGQVGVEAVFRTMLSDLSSSMAAAGYTSITDLKENMPQRMIRRPRS